MKSGLMFSCPIGMQLSISCILKTIFFTFIGLSPAFAQQPIDSLIEKAKSQTISLPELASSVLEMSEVDQSLVPEPDRLVLQFNGFAEIF